MNKFFIFFLPLYFLCAQNSSWGSPDPDKKLIRRIPPQRAHQAQGEASQTVLSGDKLSILVWNIKKTEEPNWKNEFVRFSSGKDLLLLQEVYLNSLFERTVQRFKSLRWDFGISFEYKKLLTGVSIASNVTPSEIIIKQTQDLEPVVLTPKATAFAKYPLSGEHKELLVISVHGINITSTGSFKRHMQQAVEEINKHDGPILWAGDFNTRTQKRTRHLMDLVKKLGFTEVKFKNGHQRMVFKFTRNYLDHAFVRGLKVLSAEVIGSAKGSDHKPLLLDLALQ